jgi:GT2 family glycosyltransferase
MEFAPVNETGGWLWSCNMMFHRDVFQRIGGFDESFPSAHMEDVDLRERLRAAEIAFRFVPGAQIQHPARRSDWRESLGRTHESEAMFWYKSGNRRPFWPSLLKNVVIGRTRWILGHRLNGDSFLFWTMSVREFFYVLRAVWGWERKYRQKYALGGGFTRTPQQAPQPESAR